MGKTSTATSRTARTAATEALATRGATNAAPGKKALAPRSLAIAERGVKTGSDFANLMSALMSDVIDGRINPAVATASCNAGGKLLKVVEMGYRYGSQDKRTGDLLLARG